MNETTTIDDVFETVDPTNLFAPAILIAAGRTIRTQRDELRAILAPLLEDPWRDVIVGDDEGRSECVFCGAGTHEADCPVLRKDALLGHQ